MSTVEQTENNQMKLKDQSKFSAVVFDFDGTLADSFQFILDVYTNEVSKKLPEVDSNNIISIAQKILEEEIREKMKNPKTLILRVFYKSCRELGLGRSTSSYISLRSALKVQRHYNRVEIFPSAEEVLKELNLEGIPTILITLSSKKKVMEILEKHNIDQYFQIIIDKHDLGNVEKSKGIGNALEAMGINKQELARTIVLGDLPADIKDGKIAGTQTGALLTGPLEPIHLIDSEPDYVFQDLNEFLSIYKEKSQ
ncbi:MAG: HAD family hydrolase [Candidatus Heimdallarchaeota archaeon]